MVPHLTTKPLLAVVGQYSRYRTVPVPLRSWPKIVLIPQQINIKINPVTVPFRIGSWLGTDKIMLNWISSTVFINEFVRFFCRLVEYLIHIFLLASGPPWRSPTMRTLVVGRVGGVGVGAVLPPTTGPPPTPAGTKLSSLSPRRTRALWAAAVGSSGTTELYKSVLRIRISLDPYHFPRSGFVPFLRIRIRTISFRQKFKFKSN